MVKIELYHDNFQNYKRSGIPAKAQLVIADIPYNLGRNAYASNPMWYEGGDNRNGESKKANAQFFRTDNNFNYNRKNMVENSEYHPKNGNMTLIYAKNAMKEWSV